VGKRTKQDAETSQETRPPRFIVRRFMSRSEFKALKKEGLRFDPDGGGIRATTCNFDPRSEDEARAKTGAACAEVMVDLDVRGLNRGAEGKTRFGLPEYIIQGDLGKENIVNYCPVNPKKRRGNRR